LIGEMPDGKSWPDFPPDDLIDGENRLKVVIQLCRNRMIGYL